MANTITVPVSIPSDGDLGKTFWDQLETFGNRINDHIHTGMSFAAEVDRSDINFAIDQAISLPAGGTADFDLTSYTYVSALTALVQLRDADNDYEIVDFVKISAPNANTIRITSDAPMSGNFRLIVRGA